MAGSWEHFALPRVTAHGILLNHCLIKFGYVDYQGRGILQPGGQIAQVNRKLLFYK